MSTKIINKTHKSSKYDMSFDDDEKNNSDQLDQINQQNDPSIDLLENFHDEDGNFVDYSSDSSDDYSDNIKIDISDQMFNQQNDHPKYDHSFNIPSFNINKYSKHGSNHHHHMQNHHKYHQHHHSRHQRAKLSPGDQYRKKISDENRKIVRKHPELIDWNGVKTIGVDHCFNIPRNINRKCSIRVFDCSTIRAAIECNSAHPSAKICLLNFANPIKPGGGYLDGKEGQEGSICRQTLLFPTLGMSYMYNENKRRGSKPEASDIMIYSPNVMVIRDDKYEMINNFPVDIISASAVDNRKYHIYNSEEIMENRIRKIILTAAEEKVDILILGAFGCGIFKNNSTTTARIFHKILVEENYQKFFYLIIFPIYNDANLYHIFNSILGNK